MRDILTQDKTSPSFSDPSQTDLVEENRRLSQRIETMEKEAEVLAERNLLLADSIKLGYWEWDEIEDKPAHLSQAFAEIFGLELSELYKIYQSEEDLYGFIHPEDRGIYQRHVEMLTKDKNDRGQVYIFDYRIIRPSGEVRNVRELEYGIEEEEGVLVRSFGAVQDTTEYHRALIELKDSEQRYGVLFNHLPLGIQEQDYTAIKTLLDKLIADGVEDLRSYLQNNEMLVKYAVKEAKTTSINHTLVKIYRADSVEHFSDVDMDVDAWWDESWLEFYISEFMGLLGGDHIYFAEKSDTRIDNSPFETRFITRVVGGYEDTWERVITVLEDITERRQNELALIEAKAEAENANQAKSQFLSSMSHELRTPLNAIMGFSQLFEYDQSLTQQQQSKAHEIYEAGSHLLSLVNGILDLSRIESGEFEISIEAVSLQEVVDDAAKWVADLASQKNISVEYDSEQLAGIIVGGDKLKLKQIFSNLLSNAVKYNRPEGSVSIIYEKMGERLRIGIKDTGPGIPEKLKDALFQPFNRLGAETSGIEGTGIGLVITRQLANKMNGQIDLDSIVGEGSTFWVELPLAEMIQAPEKSLDENATQASDVATKNPTDLERLKILVAEDNPVNSELLEAQLEVLQCSADYAENGAEALSLWQKDDYQILLTDIRMPIMDGYELTKRIRALEIESGKSSVIIAITANAMKDDIENCLASGANDVLNKPFSLDELEQILVKWVSTIVL